MRVPVGWARITAEAVDSGRLTRTEIVQRAPYMVRPIVTPSMQRAGAAWWHSQLLYAVVL